MSCCVLTPRPMVPFQVVALNELSHVLNTVSTPCCCLGDSPAKPDVHLQNIVSVHYTQVLRPNLRLKESHKNPLNPPNPTKYKPSMFNI